MKKFERVEYLLKVLPGYEFVKNTPVVRESIERASKRYHADGIMLTDNEIIRLMRLERYCLNSVK
jgi:hypothetical protein